MLAQVVPAARGAVGCRRVVSTHPMSMRVAGRLTAKNTQASRRGNDRTHSRRCFGFNRGGGVMSPGRAYATGMGRGYGSPRFGLWTGLAPPTTVADGWVDRRSAPGPAAALEPPRSKPGAAILSARAHRTTGSGAAAVRSRREAVLLWRDLQGRPGGCYLFGGRAGGVIRRRPVGNGGLQSAGPSVEMRSAGRRSRRRRDINGSLGLARRMWLRHGARRDVCQRDNGRSGSRAEGMVRGGIVISWPSSCSLAAMTRTVRTVEVGH